jgi:hypothetical protein
MKKELTENQSKFLDALFDEAKGNPVAAKKLAGYSETTSTQAILDSLSDEIADRTRKAIAYSGPKAVAMLSDILSGTEILGVKEKLAAAKDLLDRAGFAKTDKIQVESSTPLFVLPAKTRDEDDD